MTDEPNTATTQTNRRSESTTIRWIDTIDDWDAVLDEPDPDRAVRSESEGDTSTGPVGADSDGEPVTPSWERNTQSDSVFAPERRSTTDSTEDE